MTSQTATQKRRRRIWRRRVLLVVGTIIVLFLLAVLIDSLLYNNKVHAGVTIAGRSMSGLTRAEATARVNQVIEEAWDVEVILSSEGKTWAVSPAGVGLEIEVTSAVSAALDLSRESNFLVDLGRRFKLYFSHKNVPLQGTVDGNLMSRILADVSRQLDLPPVEAGLVVRDGTVAFMAGQKGYVVDRALLSDQLRETLLKLVNTEIPVPMMVKDPAVQVQDHQEALEQAETMVSAPVVLEKGEKTWTLSPEQVATYMDYASEDRDGVATLVVSLSAERMGPFLKEVAAATDVEPVDATFKADGEQAWVVPGVMGARLDPQETAKALTAAALKRTSRTAKAIVTEVWPDLAAKEADAMGIRQKLATFTTKWEGTEDRQTNVRITTQYASDAIVAPGEIYDFDKQIGPRTEDRGYKLAPGINRGELEDVLGGGICQVSTTLFNAAFLAGLDIVERKNHSVYIDHYPKGRDATVSSNGPNMRFRNDTEHYILIKGKSDGITTTFTIYGTRDGRKVTFSDSGFYDEVPRAVYEIPASWLGPGTTFVKIVGQAGKSIKVFRKVTAKDGTVIHDDTFLSEWKMVTREIEVGISTTTTTTEPTGTTGTEPASTTVTANP